MFGGNDGLFSCSATPTTNLSDGSGCSTLYCSTALTSRRFHDSVRDYLPGGLLVTAVPI